MRGKTLLLIAPRADGREVHPPLAEAVLTHWQGGDAPTVRTMSFGQLHDDATDWPRDGAVAWIILDQRNQEGLYNAIEALQERMVPTLLTRPGDDGPAGTVFHEGVIVAPTDTPPAMLGAILRSLASQIDVIQSLNAEMRIMRAQQGGLCGQMESIDEELRLASQLQREFLPRSLPHVQPVDFRVLFRPAGYVSGDIYDVERLDEEHVAFFLADAVGHGVPAALLTMFIKRSLQTKRISDDVPHHYQLVRPNEALAQLNRDMCAQQSGKVRFATACYGVINCKTLELCFARAGHPYPLLLRPDGTSDLLEAQGALLGVFPEEEFEMMCVQLQPGERLLLYSDGFEVAFDPSNKLQYTDELKKLAQGPIDNALAHLAATLDRQQGSLHQNDDITALLLDVAPTATPVKASAEQPHRVLIDS